MANVTYEGYAEIVERVDNARRAWSRTYVTENVFRFVVLFCGTLLLFSLLASAGTPPGFVRWAMLGVLVVLLIGGAVRLVFKPLFRVWTDEEVAVHVESKFAQLDNAVINSLQLANDESVGESGFVAGVVREAERQTRGLRFAESIDRRALAHLGLVAGVILLGLGIYAFGFREAFARSLQRILLPSAYVPTVGNAHIVSVEPGSTTVVAGDPLRVLVRFRKLGREEVDGTMVYTPAGATEVRREMKPLDADKFLFTIPEVRTPLAYRVNVGGTESDLYQVLVTERPAVTRIDVEYQFPTYTGEKVRRDDDSNGDLKALAGTRARLFLTANKSIRSGAIQGYRNDAAEIALAVDKDNERRLTGELTITESGSYTIRIVDKEGIENRSPIIHRVTALPDRPPTVRITAPAKDVIAEPGDKVAIAFAATDDYGLVVAELIARREHSKDEGLPAARWTTFADPRNVLATHSFYLDPKAYKPGDAVEYWIIVTDNRSVAGAPAGQSAKTPPYLIKVQDKQQVADEKIKNYKSWEERLRKVLEQEVAARDTAPAMQKLDDLGQFAAMLGPLHNTQHEARLEVLRIAGDIQPADPNSRRIKEVLYALAANEMADAVRQAEMAARVNELAGKRQELKKLEADVAKIIATLEKLLDVLPKLEEQAKKEAEEDAAFDLSEDAKEKLKDLERGLKDFIEEQKKVIDATQDLAQKNVDNFTKEKDLKLKELEATEDKWSQFFAEKHNDLSKLPEQDLSNSTLLKELLEVQSEVQMAKDALAKKSQEIATAIEDNGLEMAKSLTTHIEKWLPDTPDRDKWKMEETLGDAEAPMAELPKELEDLVGDLMEKEEDLMDEVEDATAGYADSLDKGAGWDAMDGPISNMSAQGVTGNRLPNKSEIGGRSGEGRSGKSSGEFVEEDATGKGGRKTPTRLTPDAFEKGQINDTSKDPTGGSTGGGKASGAGAGGLEGPVPPQVEAKLKNMAAKQAELRNKAEKIDAQFKVMQWPSPFAETTEAMKQNEVDLQNARYESVLRRRPILLKNLKGTRTFLSEQVQINKDYSTPLPSYLQDEILDATQGGTPRGYEQLLKDYYKSISQQPK